MIVLDPAIFSEFVEGAGSESERTARISKQLEDLVLAENEFGARIVASRDYWFDFYNEYVHPAFEATTNPELRRALTRVRGSVKLLIPPPKSTASTWGIRSLTDYFGAKSSSLADGMTEAAAIGLHLGEAVCIFTAQVEGRNLDVLRAGHTELRKKLRWRLYLLSPGLPGPLPVPCLSNLRNFQLPWTARLDERLPGVRPHVGTRFVPPENWQIKATECARTVAGKPAWIDEDGNAWIDPNTPGEAYHWDVHYAVCAHSPNGRNPANITRWGVPASEGQEGSVHHTPRRRR